MNEHQRVEWKASWRDEYLRWICGFANPGHLPEGWTLEHLIAKHASRPFNPDIANVFFRSRPPRILGAWHRADHSHLPRAGMPSPQSGHWEVLK